MEGLQDHAARWGLRAVAVLALAGGLLACSSAPPGGTAGFLKQETRTAKGVEVKASVGPEGPGCRIEAAFRNTTRSESELMTLAVRAFDGKGKLRSLDVVYARAMAGGEQRVEIKPGTRICELAKDERQLIEFELY